MKNRVMAVVLSCVLVLVGSAQVSVAASVGVVKSGKSVDVCVDSVSRSVRVLGSGCVSGRELKQVWSAGVGAPALCVSRVSRDVLIAPASGCGAGAKLLKASSGGRALLCADGVSGVLRWPETGVCNSTNRSLLVRLFTPKSVPVIVPVVAAPAVAAPAVVPAVSLAATTIGDGTWPKAVTVTSNVVGTVYFAEGDFVVKTVSDITSAPSYRWAKGTITAANTPTSIAVDVDVVSNGYYRVYVANAQGVLSAPAVNKLTISITREADLPRQSVVAAPTVCSSVGVSSTDFVMTVDTNYSLSDMLTLPLRGTYDVSVDWGDGTSQEAFATGGTPSHHYSSEGIYTIRISGDLEHFGVLVPTDNTAPWSGVDMVVAVSSFGSLGIESLEGAFYLATNLCRVPSTLPASVTNLTATFAGALVFNQSLNSWDVSHVFDMSAMFYGAIAFNGDISSWVPSDVIDMHQMFAQATAFNQNIGSWDVSRVTDMSSMFYNALAFNQNIGGWETTRVTDMAAMFYGATSFNGDISGWNTLRVTNMAAMFSGATAFNRNIGGWDVNNVTNMSFMFSGASVFDGDISSWDTSAVTDMSGMFAGATAFNQNIRIWDVSEVTNMSNMFQAAYAFNQNVKDWDVHKVTNMSYMFASASAFNNGCASNVQDCDMRLRSRHWDTRSVVDMSYMFFNTNLFNQDIDDWDVSNVTNMEGMFRGAVVFNQSLNSWNVGIVINMKFMFASAYVFNGDISSWIVSKVTDMKEMFYYALSFNQNISGWNVSEVTDMHGMFYVARQFNQNLDAWINKVSNVTDMGDMFVYSGLANNPIWYVSPPG